SAGREPELATLEPDIQGPDRRVDQLVPQPAATATFSASLRHRPAHHGAGRCTRGRLRQLCPVLPRLSPAGGTGSDRAAHRPQRRCPEPGPRPSLSAPDLHRTSRSPRVCLSSAGLPGAVVTLEGNMRPGSRPAACGTTHLGACYLRMAAPGGRIRSPLNSGRAELRYLLDKFGGEDGVGRWSAQQLLVIAVEIGGRRGQGSPGREMSTPWTVRARAY